MIGSGVVDETPSGSHGRLQDLRSRLPLLALRFMVITGMANALLYLYPTVVARSLNPPAYGEFAAVFNIAAIFGALLGALQAAVAAEAARSDAERLARLVSIVAWCALAVSALGAVGLLLSARSLANWMQLPSTAPVLAGGAFALMLVPWASALGVLQGTNRIDRIAWLSVAHSALRLGALVALIWTRSPAILFAALAVAVLPSVLIAWQGLSAQRGSALASLRSGLAWVTGHRAWVVAAVSYSAAVGFASLADVSLVKGLYSPSDAGLYAGASLFGRAIIFTAIAVNTVVYPRLVVASGWTAAHLIVVQARRVVLGISLPAAIGVAAWPTGALELVLGDQYRQANELLPWYLAASVGVAVSSVYLTAALARAANRVLTLASVGYLGAAVTVPFLAAPDITQVATGYAILSAVLLTLVTWWWATSVSVERVNAVTWGGSP